MTVCTGINGSLPARNTVHILYVHVCMIWANQLYSMICCTVFLGREIDTELHLPSPTLIRSRFEAEPATFLIPINIFPFSTVTGEEFYEKFYGIRYQSDSSFLTYVERSGFFHCLRSSLNLAWRISTGQFQMAWRHLQSMGAATWSTYREWEQLINSTYKEWEQLINPTYRAREQRLYIGLARAIYIRCTYGIFGREFTNYTVIYGLYIRFWPTLPVYNLQNMGAPTLSNLQIMGVAT